MARKKVDLASRLAGVAGQAEAEVDAAAETASKVPGTYRLLPVEVVAGNPGNVRDSVGDVADLAESMRTNGVLQAIVVRPLALGEELEPAGARYVVVMGNRRLAAAREAGLAEIPAVIREDLAGAGERRTMLVENLQRQNLTALEEARAYQLEMAERGVSQRALAKEVGVSQAHVSRRLALLTVAPSLQEAVAAGQIGVDVVVTHVVDLVVEDQAALAEYVASQEDPPGPKQVRGWVDSVLAGRKAEQENEKRRQEAAQRQEAQVAEIIGRGGHPLSFVELSEQLSSRYYELEIDSDEEIATAAEGGCLYGVAGPGGIRWFDASKELPEPTRHGQREAEERAEWNRRRKGVAAWVAAHGEEVPPAGELVDVLAGWVLQTVHQSEGAVVHKWLGGETECHEWLRQERSGEETRRVAWLVTIAQTLADARYSTGPDRARVDEMVAEMEGGLS